MLVAVRERKENRAVGGGRGQNKKGRAQSQDETKRASENNTAKEKRQTAESHSAAAFTHNHDTPGPKNTFTYIGVDGFVKRSLQCLV
jgi:hypothetical protein